MPDGEGCRDPGKGRWRPTGAGGVVVCAVDADRGGGGKREGRGAGVGKRRPDETGGVLGGEGVGPWGRARLQKKPRTVDNGDVGTHGLQTTQNRGCISKLCKNFELDIE